MTSVAKFQGHAEHEAGRGLRKLCGLNGARANIADSIEGEPLSGSEMECMLDAT
jgi:hypothetical protein